MKKFIIYFISILSFININSNLFAQLPSAIQWSATNSPPVPFRYEDVFFLNADTGFAVHHYSSSGIFGYITRTTDGGNNWINVLDSTTFEFRDIAFTNNLHGFAGTIEHSGMGADTNIIYKTSDGGFTWQGVNNFPGPDSAGICGLQAINDTTLYGVGRYFGPAIFYKTTDNGLSWSYVNLDSLVLGLVDIYFFNPDTGFAIGSVGPNYSSGYGRILYTTNGGNTWSVAFTSSKISTMGWKINFPSRNTGYVSLQFFGAGSQYFIKTIDGGVNWQEIQYVGGPPIFYVVQGIGFLNDSIGWVGGLNDVYITINGGISWQLQTWGKNLNRFRFLSDTLAYAAGFKIYKMHVLPTSLTEINSNVELIAYPNPSNSYIYFEFALQKKMQVKLSVYDLNGKEVTNIFKTTFPQGNNQFIWQAQNLSPGLYICILSFGDQVIRQKLEIVE